MNLERDINIAVDGCFGFTTSTQKGPFMAIWISHSRGTYVIPLTPITDQVSVADDGEVVLGAHSLRLDPVEVAGEADEPVVVLAVAVRLPVSVELLVW